MIVPTVIDPQLSLIQHAALAMRHYVGNPDTAYSKGVGGLLRDPMQLFEQRLISETFMISTRTTARGVAYSQFLCHACCMASNDCDISQLRCRVVRGYVLLHGEL